jgi:hypothetical protein
LKKAKRKIKNGFLTCVPMNLSALAHSAANSSRDTLTLLVIVAVSAALHKKNFTSSKTTFEISFISIAYLTTRALELESPAEGGIRPDNRQRRPVGAATPSSS